MLSHICDPTAVWSNAGTALAHTDSYCLNEWVYRIWLFIIICGVTERLHPLVLPTARGLRNVYVHVCAFVFSYPGCP